MRASYATYKAPQVRGFTLVEMIVVVAILGVVALVAIPSFSSSTDQQKLDLAAQEVASALRFARHEAMRIHSDISAPGGANIVAVDIGDTGNSLGTGYGAGAVANHVGVYTYSGLTRQPFLTHPIDKKNFDIEIPTAPFTAGVQITAVTFNSGGALLAGTMFGFDGDGTPYQFVNAGTALTKAPLIGGTVELLYGGRKRLISIDANGRVGIL